MGVALELPVALEEVLFDVADHALRLAFGPRALRPARLRREAVVVGQLQEAGVEDHPVVPVMLQHRRFLVVDQYRAWDHVEVAECLHQGLEGVFGILARGQPGVEPSLSDATQVEKGICQRCGRETISAPIGC